MVFQGRAMTVCVLSALILASCYTTSVSATNTSDVEQSRSQVVTQHNNNDTQVSHMQEQSIPERSQQEQSQPEQSRLEQSTQEQSNQEQSVPEQSQPEIVDAPILEGEQTIYFRINFGGAFVRASTCLEKGYIDLSNVKPKQ